MCVGRHVEALELLDKALRLDPYRVDYQVDIGFVALTTGYARSSR